MAGRNESGRFTDGNRFGKGRKIGSKNRQPGLDFKLEAIEEYGRRWIELLGEMANSPNKRDRQRFVELFTKFLPKDSNIKMDLPPQAAPSPMLHNGKELKDLTDAELDEFIEGQIKRLKRAQELICSKHESGAVPFDGQG